MTNAITETIGIDLGDRYSAYCVLDQGTGEVEEEGRIRAACLDILHILFEFPTAQDSPSGRLGLGHSCAVANMPEWTRPVASAATTTASLNSSAARAT
jgi:hypothetical protein